MQINFYEEFPTKKNLEKLKLIKFPSRVFIATRSLKEFQDIEKQVKKINNKIKAAYWPLIKNSYWISPFSNTEDLIELLSELNKTESPLLIDLEPPFLNKKLFLKNLFKINKTKKLIREFIKKNKKRITTAQHPFPNSKLMKFLGLDYDIKVEKSLMYYSSANSSLINFYIKKKLKNIKNKKDYLIGLGVLAEGVITKKLLTFKNLEKDLEFVKNAGFKKVIIFRVGGLNKEYMKVIEKFI